MRLKFSYTVLTGWAGIRESMKIKGETMQKYLRLTVMVMALFSVLLFLLIIRPDAARTTAAADLTDFAETSAEHVDPLKPDMVDSGGQPTDSAIEEEKNPSDVNNEIIEPQVAFQLKYDKYPLTYTYLLVQNESVKIRKGPSASETVLKAAPKNEKLNYIETVVKDDGKWYHVTWQEKDRQYFGFVHSEAVTKRSFEFDRMHETILRAEKTAEKGDLTYISNYHNGKGWAPLYQGGELDKIGGRRSQSAPGYPDPSNLNEFNYLGDGTLVRVLTTGAQYTRVALVKDERVYFVPNKYVVTPAAVSSIRKAIVIDRANQNEAAFEKIGQEWKVVSYTLATTGTTGKYHQPTPLGYFYGIEKRERFYYYKDGTTTIQGYAPWAIRFAGGAYLHGVPVNYKYDSEGNRVDPGKIEYSRTLGTVPLSHKCVRNYTSHAKFLYDWYTPGEMIVIVME